MKNKISKIVSFTYDQFSFRKSHRNKNWFLTEIYIWVCWHLFPSRKSLGIPRTIFSTLSSGSAAIKNPRRHLFFYPCIETWLAKGAFWMRILRKCSYFWIKIVWTLRYIVLTKLNQIEDILGQSFMYHHFVANSRFCLCFILAVVTCFKLAVGGLWTE